MSEVLGQYGHVCIATPFSTFSSESESAEPNRQDMYSKSSVNLCLGFFAFSSLHVGYEFDVNGHKISFSEMRYEGVAWATVRIHP